MSALQLNLYISKKQNEVSNRVEISNVTPFERHLWNEIVSKQTSTQNQRDVEKFIKFANGGKNFGGK